MDLTCYLHPGWRPLIRPAPASRPWMDATPEAFAYRCLPLNIANAHGWEVLSPCAFEAAWDGRPGIEGVSIRLDPGSEPYVQPASIFGQGVMTFHIEALFRTPPGWDLWVSGSPNRPKDGIAPLTGVVETDWSPFTFTMNWRFTRPNLWVRFERFEPICFFFPVMRDALTRVEPHYEPIESAPELAQGFADWSRERDAFQRRIARNPPKAPSDRWQKHYYRGVDIGDKSHTETHRTKLRLPEFDRGSVVGLPSPPDDDALLPKAVGEGPTRAAGSDLELRRREWLLRAMEAQRAQSPASTRIERRIALTQDQFLVSYYAPGRPVILVGETFGRTPGAKPADGMTAASATQAAATRDPWSLAKFIAHPAATDPRVRSAPAGSRAPLNQLIENLLVVQLAGRQQFKLLPPSEVGRLYGPVAELGEDADLERILQSDRWNEALRGAQVYRVDLEPGEALFAPLGWWIQAVALKDATTHTYTDFIWKNDAAASYPRD
jgi:hypothetical protein